MLAKAERDDFLRVGEVELGALTDELLDKAHAPRPRAAGSSRRAARRGMVADRQRLTQAVMGLAQNAVQHTRRRTTRSWIGSAVDDARRASGSATPGRGSRARTRRASSSASRAPARSRRRSEGAGLGLAIVRAIAEAHGGRVELVSRPGAGATFTIVIPLGPEAPSR